MKKRMIAAAAALLMLCGCRSDPESENGMQWFSAEFPETVQPSGEQGYAYHDGEILLDYWESELHCSAAAFLEQYTDKAENVEKQQFSGLDGGYLALETDPEGWQIQYCAAGRDGRVFSVGTKANGKENIERAKDLMQEIMQTVTYQGKPLQAGTFKSDLMKVEYPAALAEETQQKGDRYASVHLVFADAQTTDARSCTLEISADLDGADPEDAARRQQKGLEDSGLYANFASGSATVLGREANMPTYTSADGKAVHSAALFTENGKLISVKACVPADSDAANDFSALTDQVQLHIS